MQDKTCGTPLKGSTALKQQKTTEDNHAWKKAKDINENVVDDELKYED